MSIDKAKLASHLDDYSRVTGRKTGRFVCPITLHECEEDELIDGHILNKGIRNASRRTVIQYGRVDHFYGSRVEAGLVRLLNLRHKTDFDILTRTRELWVTLPDGSKVQAFPAGSSAARKAEGHFPRVELIKNEKHFASVYLQIPYDSPNVSGPIDVSRTETFYRYDWVASLVKAGYLALFDMLGYESVFTAWGDTVRRSLSQFYEDNATHKNAGNYFSDFRNSIHVMTARSLDDKGEIVRRDYSFDTLTDREVLLHFTQGWTMFAATCIFKVNEVTVTVTLPGSTPGADAAMVLDWYRRTTQDPVALPQMVHRSRFDNRRWLMEEKALPLGILNARSW